VHVVAGPPGSGKSALIARLARERGDWLGLSNSVLAGAAANLMLLSAGCPCCTGRVALQVSLARSLRESGASRAFLELGDVRHAAALARLLNELPLSLSLTQARTILLPQDSAISAGALES